MSKKETWKLVTFHDNWADEMDIEGYRIFSEDDWKNYRKYAKKEFEENGEYTYYVGTNEDINYNSYEDFMGNFEVKTISKEQVDVLEKLELDGGMGFFPENIGEGFDDE
jgi:hypothetical protein